MSAVFESIQALGTSPLDCIIPVASRPVCATSHGNTESELMDAIRESQIVTSGLRIELANVLMGQRGATYHLHVAERDGSRLEMETLIGQRSPGMVARLEAERGLTA